MGAIRLGLGLTTSTATAAQLPISSVMGGLSPPSYRIEPRASVEVVVPTLNEAKYLPYLLRSIENQTEPVARVVVADSFSDDETAEIASDYGATVVEVPQGNVASARNAGAARCSGDFLLFADADVILPQRFLERALDTLFENEEALAVHPREVIYDSGFWNTVQFLTAGVMRMRAMTTRCVVIRAEAFDAIGGYSEACNPMDGCREDLELGKMLTRTFGYRSVRPIPFGTWIGTSGRRQKMFGLSAFDMDNWGTPARAMRR